MSNIKLMCQDYKCNWAGMSDDVLNAPNPFEDGEITACPKCKAIEELTSACGIDGCWHAATCGTPTADGYVQCCGKHFQELQP